MNDVFLLWHSHKKSDGDDDEKLVGIYRSRSAAEAAIRRTLELPGFRDHPEGLLIDCYQLDVDHWSEGFSEV